MNDYVVAGLILAGGGFLGVGLQIVAGYPGRLVPITAVMVGAGLVVAGLRRDESGP